MRGVVFSGGAAANPHPSVTQKESANKTQNYTQVGGGIGRGGGQSLFL